MIKLSAVIDVDEDFVKATGYAVYLRRRAVRDLANNVVEFYLTVSGEVDTEGSKDTKDYVCRYNREEDRIYTCEFLGEESETWVFVEKVKFDNKDVLGWVIENVKKEIDINLSNEALNTLERKQEFRQREDTLNIGWAESDGQCAYYNVTVEQVSVRTKGDVEAVVLLDVCDALGRNRTERHAQVKLSYKGHLTDGYIVGDSLYRGQQQLSHVFWKHSDYGYDEDIYDDIKERVCVNVRICLRGE